MTPSFPPLAGRNSSNPFAAGAMLTLAMLIILAPLWLMGGAMVLVGAGSWSPRTSFPELWICLPAGIMLLGCLAFFPYMLLARIPRRTMLEFRLAERFAYETPQGRWDRALDEIHSVERTRGRHRARRNRGWTISFTDGTHIYLPPSVSHVDTLAKSLRERLSLIEK